MFNKFVIITYFLFANTFIIHSQNNKVKLHDLYFGGGLSFNYLVEQQNSKVHDLQTGFTLSILKTHLLSKKNMLLLGLNYNFKRFDNFINTVYSPDYNKNVILNTSLVFQQIEIPVLYCFTSNKFIIGGGLNFQYLIFCELNETSTPNMSLLTSKYNYSNYSSDAPFQKTNIAPCLLIGYKLKEKIILNAVLDYDLVSNPINIDINKFNILTNKILIYYKL